MIKWKNKPGLPGDFYALAREMTGRYFRHGVARSSAALTYYLVFAGFGVLVAFSRMLGALEMDEAEILAVLERFLPAQVMYLARWYLRQVADEAAGGLWSGILLAVWFPMRATSCLLWAVERAMGSGKGHRGWRGWLRTLLFTLWLLLTLGLTLALITAGRGLLMFLAGLPELPAEPSAVGNALRFAVLAAVMFVSLGLLYLLALGGRQPFSRVVPGVAASLAAWLAVSAGFSFYVERVADYTRLYGSITAVVVTLLWLYMTAVVLIMGAELNGALHRRRIKKET